MRTEQTDLVIIAIFQVCTHERPLFILLDSLDQLSNSHRAHNLVWLPTKLPANVRMLVSTLPDENNILKTLKVSYFSLAL